MIELTSFLHRGLLRSLMARWLANDLHAGDPYLVKELVNYNSLFVRRAREHLSALLLSSVYGEDLAIVPLSTKGALRDLLRDAVLAGGGRDGERVAELVTSYGKDPDRFFRETPYEGVAYRLPGSAAPVAFSRIKRIRRIAEKCSRRIIDSVFSHIQEEARQIAVRRSRARGIPPGHQALAAAERQREFFEAEERVLSELRSGRLVRMFPKLAINDVLGFKLLGDDGVAARLEQVIADHPELELVEREEHRGDYNATNYVVTWRCSPRALTERDVSPAVAGILCERGLGGDPSQGFRDFVRTGETDMRFEIIFQSFAAMMESEFGRCIHEERVIQQRYEQVYRGYVVRNIRVLIQFLFSFAISRATVCEAIPIRLWVRYMPDYHDLVLAGLSDFPVGHIGLTP